MKEAVVFLQGSLLIDDAAIKGNQNGGFISSDFKSIRIFNGNIHSGVASKVKQSGKWYWEITVEKYLNASIGITSLKEGVYATRLSSDTSSRYIGSNGRIYSGSKVVNVNNVSSRELSNGSVVGFALDIEKGTLDFYLNGVFKIQIANDLSSHETVVPFCSTRGTSSNCIFHAAFAESDFKYKIPDGFLAYDYNPPNKILIKKDQKLFTLSSNSDVSKSENSTWMEVQSPEEGIEDISLFNRRVIKKEVDIINSRRLLSLKEFKNIKKLGVK